MKFLILENFWHNTIHNKIIKKIKNIWKVEFERKTTERQKEIF